MEKILSPVGLESVLCHNCKNIFQGKICNCCGERVFSLSQLSSRSFFKHILQEIGTPYDNKLLKSMWLTFRKPGFLTKENLRGVRIPYAKPVQLFIVVNLVFYILVNYFGRTDYIPSIGDNYSSFISHRPFLEFTAPLDYAIAGELDELRIKRMLEFRENLSTSSARSFVPFSGDINKEFSDRQVELLAFQAYNQKVSFLSKTLIFTLVPVIALVFFLVFRKKLKYYGAALILATHFLVFNLLLYMASMLLNFLPEKLFQSQTLSRIPNRIIDVVFYNAWLEPVSTVFLGLYNGFEAIHIIAWTLWLFLALKRLFNLHWLKNLIYSYLLSRLFFILIFSLYKKFLIACTFWLL